jgi:hypothetical protein
MLSFLFLFVCWVMVTLSAGIAKAEFALSPPYPATLIHSGRGALAAGSSDYSTRHHLYYSQLVPYYFSGNRRLAAAAGSMPTNHYGYLQQGELAIYIIFSFILEMNVSNWISMLHSWIELLRGRLPVVLSRSSASAYSASILPAAGSS